MFLLPNTVVLVRAIVIILVNNNMYSVLRSTAIWMRLSARSG